MNKTSRRNINKKCSTNTSSSTSTSASASAGVNCGQGNGENRDQAELNVDLKLEKNLELELVNGFSNDSSISGTKFKKKGLENGKHMLLMGPRVQAADGLARNDVNNFTNTTTTSAGAGTGTAGASATLTTFTGNRNSERGCSSSSRAEEKSSEVEEFHNFGESSGETKSKSKSKCSGHGHSEPQRRHNKFDSSENIPKTLEGDHLIGVILDDASSQTERTRTETEELIVDSRHTPTSCTLDPETNGCCSNKDDEDEGDHLIRNLEDLSIEIETTPARTEEKEEKPDSDSPPQPQVEYVQYENELQMPMIMRIIQKDLSEPYSIYTYRYFIHNWPKLCFLAMCEGNCVGAIVCKLDFYRKVIRRGYIAMLAVDKNYRKRGLGSTLVRRAIQEMIRGEADEVVLETEITNRPALQLYEGLGFVRDKRLFRYYLNGVDALRLKLWLR